jgi:adhesin/invasin
VDRAGLVYIADRANHAIRVLTPSLATVFDGGVVNAASSARRISPGALATVYGTGFGTATAQPPAPLPTSVGGISVLVNGAAAPILYLSPGQVNFQVPWGTQPGDANITVSVGGGVSNAVTVPVVTAGPGLFYDAASGAAIVQNAPEYSLNGPNNPAPVGSTIVAYTTGTGPVTPNVPNGALTPETLVRMTSQYSATIGSTPAEVSFGGLTPGFVGLGQLNIVVPAGLAAGTYPLTITIDGQASNSANISVR